MKNKLTTLTRFLEGAWACFPHDGAQLLDDVDGWHAVRANIQVAAALALCTTRRAQDKERSVTVFEEARLT